MWRRVLGVVIGLAVVGALGLVLADGSGTQTYLSVGSLGGAIRTHAIGCARIYPTRAITQPGEDMAVCEIGPATVTLHTYRDASMLRRLDEPTFRSGVSWVVGPNWLVATMDRPAAAQVALAIGGELIP
jgi:hypothetical protein